MFRNSAYSCLLVLLDKINDEFDLTTLLNEAPEHHTHTQRHILNDDIEQYSAAFYKVN